MHTDKTRSPGISHLRASVPHLWLLFLILFLAREVTADDQSVAGPWTVPIREIRYFPVTADGKKIDINVTSNVGAPLEAIRSKCDRMTREAMTALPEGSRYHAHSDPAAKASLKYEVLETNYKGKPLTNWWV